MYINLRQHIFFLKNELCLLEICTYVYNIYLSIYFLFIFFVLSIYISIMCTKQCKFIYLTIYLKRQLFLRMNNVFWTYIQHLSIHLPLKINLYLFLYPVNISIYLYQATYYFFKNELCLFDNDMYTLLSIYIPIHSSIYIVNSIVHLHTYIYAYI